MYGLNNYYKTSNCELMKQIINYSGSTSFPLSINNYDQFYRNYFLVCLSFIIKILIPRKYSLLCPFKN